MSILRFMYSGSIDFSWNIYRGTSRNVFPGTDRMVSLDEEW